jgi:hypothetical protein
MPGWKLVWLAKSAQRGWRLIPPERREVLLKSAEQTARKHGPVVAKTVREQGPVVARRVAGAMRQRKPPS